MILPQEKIMFIHVQKTAGSSIAKALFSKVDIEFESFTGLDEDVQEQYFCKKHQKHAVARQYKKSIPDFDSYYKFTIIRNPYDRMVSHYRFWAKKGQSFKQFEDEVLNKRYKKLDIYPTQKNFVTNKNGDIIVDDIFLYTDVAKVFDKLDLPKFHVNKNKKKSRTITEEMKTAVHKYYEEDLDFFECDKDGNPTKHITVL